MGHHLVAIGSQESPMISMLKPFKTKTIRHFQKYCKMRGKKNRMLFWCASKSSTFVDETAPQLTPHNHVKWKLAVANDIELNTRLLYIWLSLATDEFIIFYIYHIFMHIIAKYLLFIAMSTSPQLTQRSFFRGRVLRATIGPWPMRSCRVNTHNFAGSDRGVGYGSIPIP